MREEIDIMKSITAKAREGAGELNALSRDRKDKVLLAMAEGVDAARDKIKAANEEDMSKARAGGRDGAFLDRLKVDDKRIDAMCAMLRDVASFGDPTGRVIERKERPNGLVIEKISVPIGVIGIIYEARPNVTADCIALSLKSGNAVILRGGSESIRSNQEIYRAMKEAAAREKLADGAFILIEDTSRDMVNAMLTSTGAIDLIMPRGGESLIRQVVETSRIPVIKHYKGICHVYVDAEADMDMAWEICFNAKVNRPGVCNAMETMLVHEAAAGAFLPLIAGRLREAGVLIKGCARTKAILADKGMPEATCKDFATEYLDLILNVRVVSSLDEAIAHIAKFGSNHSDAIVTTNARNADEFTRRVDSAAVYVNASTRFTDGGEFGKGAEIGISTDKIHARGPIGLEELTTYKYVIHGHGQVRV